MRQAAIDENERHAAAGKRRHGAWPQFRFHEQRQIRLPVIEKPLNVMGYVERRILMNHAGGETPSGDGGRGHRAGGQKDCQATIAKPRQQRQNGIGFADAGGVYPDQRAVRPIAGGLAEALPEARRIFLAALHATLQIWPGQWLKPVCKRPVQAEPGLADSHVRPLRRRAPRRDGRRQALTDLPASASGSSRRCRWTMK